LLTFKKEFGLFPETLSTAKGSKPPLPKASDRASKKNEEHKGHPLFGTGPIPKNKDMNAFVEKINEQTPLQAFL